MTEVAALTERLLAGDRRTLAQLVTWAESKRSEDRDRVSEVLRSASRLAPRPQALRIAFTGPPGAGKSTLIECLGSRFVPADSKLAVLAFDPSSPRSGGSLLADRTRMSQLSTQHNAFIRPSPQGGNLGGLGDAAATSIELCEWAGYDSVIVETVGVGQTEIDARDQVDCVVLVLGPDGGDEIQGMKRGINETCDFVVINKRDTAEARARQLELAYRAALSVTHAASAPEVRLTSALDGSGVGELWEAVRAFYDGLVANGSLTSRRNAQRSRQLQRAFVQKFERSLSEPPRHPAVARVEARLCAGELSLDEATDVLLRQLCPEP